MCDDAGVTNASSIAPIATTNPATALITSALATTAITAASLASAALASSAVTATTFSTTTVASSVTAQPAALAPSTALATAAATSILRHKSWQWLRAVLGHVSADAGRRLPKWNLQCRRHSAGLR